MLKIILIVVAVLIVGLATAVMMQPDEFRYTHNGVIAAPVATVFPYFNNLKKSNEWSPWIEMDPDAKMTYEGPQEGVGAKLGWAGNKNIGEGSLTVLESRPNELLKLRLEFIKPFAGASHVDYTFKPQGDNTEVTWTMYGPNTLMGKVAGLFMNCEKMVTEKTEQGFANLNKILQQKPVQ